MLSKVMRFKCVLPNHAVENLEEDNWLHIEQLYQAYKRWFEAMDNVSWATWYMTATPDLTSKL